MITNNTINELLDKMVCLELTDGVQPHELAEAIFDKPYSSISSIKLKDKVIAEVVFHEYDEDDDLSTQHVIRYTYSLDRKLQTIDQKVGRSHYKLQWSRQQAINEVTEPLKILLKSAGNTEATIVELLKTIPSSASDTISEQLKSIA